MSVIRTKYLAPTNTRGARIKAALAASWGTETLTLPYDYSALGGTNHTRAAQALADKLRLLGKWYRFADVNGYVFVLAEAVDVGFTIHKREA